MAQALFCCFLAGQRAVGVHSVGMPYRPGAEAQGMTWSPGEWIAVDAMQKMHQVQVPGSTVCRSAVRRRLVQHLRQVCSSRLSAGVVDVTLDSQPSRNETSSEHTCNDGSCLQRLAQAHVLHQSASDCPAKMRMKR